MTDLSHRLQRLYDACGQNMSALARLLTRHAPPTAEGRPRQVFRPALYAWMSGRVRPSASTREAWLDAAIAAALDEVLPSRLEVSGDE
jgi:hypothetical protein